MDAISRVCRVVRGLSIFPPGPVPLECNRLKRRPLQIKSTVHPTERPAFNEWIARLYIGHIDSQIKKMQAMRAYLIKEYKITENESKK